jgi:hypothetical protein
MRFATSMLLLSLVTAAACHRHASATDYVTSCEKREALSECVEYTEAGAAAPHRDYLKKSCSVARGQFRESACSSLTGAVGRCELEGQRLWMFSDGPLAYTPESAAQRCAVIEGAWIARQ